jgi:cytochrome d ubiquinol oxidase subunit I
MEGDWESRSRAPEILFGIPNMKTERTDYKIELPFAGSLILTHSLNGKVPGLKDFAPQDRPYSPLIFFTFRIMIGLGFLMFVLGLFSLFTRWKGSFYENKWLHRFALVMAPSGFIALICGWITTEVGRQPFTVYGLLRTTDSVSPIALPGIAASMTAFVLVYFVVFGAGLLIILRLMSREPEIGEVGPDPRDPTRTAGQHPGPAQGHTGDRSVKRPGGPGHAMPAE